MLKRFLVTSIIFGYLLSTFAQTSIFRFSPNIAEAQSSSGSRTNLVAVVVDTAIYGAVKGDLARYANTYVPKQLPGTELVILPLDPSGFDAHEVHRVIENMYFDGKEDEGSALVGVIVFGDIPLPTIEMNGEKVLSMHPYTDFEGPPMFVFDPGRGVWVSNGVPNSQPELWHAVIPGRDTALFSKFFSKLKKYDQDPTEYATGEIRYDDYQMMQQSFSNEQLDGYINTLMFAQDRSYNRINSAFTDMLNGEYTRDLSDTIKVMEEQYNEIAGQPIPDSLDDPKLNEARDRVRAGVGSIKDILDDPETIDKLENLEDSELASGNFPVPTLVNAKQNENNFRTIFSLYGDEYIANMEDNLAAAGRYDMSKIDSSLEFIQLKDTIAMSYLKDMNTLVEHAVDEIIQQEQYMLKYPLPTWYEHWESSDLLACAPDVGFELDLGGGDFAINPVGGKYLSERYENFYFGRYAGDVQQYDDLHVFRGDWYNKSASELLKTKPGERSLEDIPFSYNDSSVGNSYGGFAQQTKSFRGTNFDLGSTDLELYDKFACSDDPREWAYYYRGGPSPLNLDGDKMSANPIDIDFDSDWYDTAYMRNPTVNRSIGGPQYDPAGAVRMLENEFGGGTIQPFATQSADPVFEVQQADPNCTPLEQDDDIDDDGIPNKEDPDIDDDGILNPDDGDIDQDCVPNTRDNDIDGDGDPNGQDSDCNGGGGNCGQDNDDDSDGIPDDQDPDNDNDGTPDDQEPDSDGDGIDDSEDPDDDNDGIEDEDDPDDDNDGIPDDEEPDSDGDGTPDDQDPDFNGDNGGGSSSGGGANTAQSLSILHHVAQEEFANLIKVDGISRSDYNFTPKPLLPGLVRSQREAMVCEDRETIPYQEVDFFLVRENQLQEAQKKKVISVSQNPHEQGGGVDRFKKSTNATIEIDDQGAYKAKRSPWFLEQNIPSGKEFLPDFDADGVPDEDDRDIDGDSIENEDDFDIDADKIKNTDDPDMDGDGYLNRLDKDTDGDMIDNEYDGDADADGVISDDRNDEFADDDKNDAEEGDKDKNGSKCGGGGSCGGGSKESDESESEGNPLGGPDENEETPDLEDPFDYLVTTLGGTFKSLKSIFSKNYLVIELSDSECQYCVDQAGKINQDQVLQSQLTNQCDFVILTPEGNLREWITAIGSQSSFGGGKSFEITTGTLWEVENLFEEGQRARGLPHTFIVDQDGKVVSRAMGSLPPDLETYCPAAEDAKNLGFNRFNLDTFIQFFAPVVFAQEEPDQNLNQDEEEEVCIPKPQTDDIDGDGIPNQQDHEDIDGDGLNNSEDPDVDGDCIPNTTDPDIDGDKVENGKDSDCNGNGTGCGQDNDDDSDGLNDDVDDDNDNDGTPDDEEGDNDGDGITDDEDEDDDNDGTPDEEDETPFGEDEEDKNEDEEDKDNQDDSGSGAGAGGGLGREQPEKTPPPPSDPAPDAGYSNKRTFIAGAPFDVEVRDQECFGAAGGFGTYKDWYYWDYHIVDTVVQHKAPTNHMLQQSNVLTMERPIDDPRFTTFHGIGGDLVKFIYPDLYNISIYKGGTLLDEAQIEQEVRTYFRDKIEQYNKLLNQQLAKAPGHYGTHPAAFDFLGGIHSSATPNRSYKTISPTMFENILGDEQIKRIAHSLYYLSYPWEQRPTGGTVEQMIENTRNDFDIDRKLEYVAELYALSKPGLPETEADDPIILPRYVDPTLDPSERKAYEVGYINSDGRDAMPINKDGDGFTRYTIQGDAGSSAISNNPTDVGSNTPAFNKAKKSAAADDTECKVPNSGVVALVKRPKAFACWLEKTGQKPIEFKLEVDVELQDSFIEKMMLDWVGASAISSNILSPKTKIASITQEISKTAIPKKPQLPFSIFPSVFAQNNEIAQEDIAIAEAISYGAYVQIEPSNIFSVDDIESYDLILGSDRGLGEVTVTFSSKGENGIIINGKDITQEDLRIDLVLNGIQSLPIRIEGTNADVQNIEIEICSGTDGDICEQKNLEVYVSPTGLDVVDIITPTSVVYAGGSFPIVLQGSDSSGNKIPFAQAGTELILFGASFDKEESINKREITNLTNETHIIYPNKDVDNISVRVQFDGNILGQRSLENIVVSPNVVSPLAFDLINKQQGYIKEDGTVFEDRLPSIDISFSGASREFLIPARVSGADNLLSIGSVDEDGNFTQESEFIFQGTGVSLPIIPTGVAGTGTVILSFPGLGTFDVQVEIGPSGPDNLEFDIGADGAEAGDTITGTVLISDSRGNPYLEDIEVDLEAEGGWTISKDSVIAEGGRAIFTGEAKAGGGSCGASGSCNGGGSSSSDSNSSGDGDGGDSSGENGENGSEDGENGDGENGENGEDGEGDENEDGEDGEDENKDTPDDSGGEGGGSGSSGRTEGSTTFEVNKVLRPDQRKPQDMNIMYLNLYGSHRGNKQRIIDMLKNEKTLAITTTHKIEGKSAFDDKTSTFSLDGTREDEDLSLIKEMILEGEHAWVLLGQDGGLGRYYLGTTQSLGLSLPKGSKEKQPEVSVKVLSSSCSQSKNQILINKDLIGVDFEFGFIHEDIDIIPASPTGKTWNVMYNNDAIASFSLKPNGSHTLEVELADEQMEVVSQAGNTITLGYTDIEPLGTTIPVYEGLSDAGDATKSIGFRGNFNGINNFSQGQAVGPANKWRADPLLINFGDPFLKRVEKSDKIKNTDFDGGMGQLIYSSNETMLKVETMEVDGDGKLDILIGYNDGSLRVLKNYGGGEPYTPIGTLIVISDGLKDFWPGDVDGDGDDDVIVLTTSEKLRAYKNNNGVLEVDGRPICIDIPNGEFSSVSQTNQLFVKDIDGDETLDIVSYAIDGEIEVFYGGGDSYISTDPFMCDEGAIGRNNKNLLKSLKLTASQSFSDNSLVHWAGLEMPEEEPIPPSGHEGLVDPIDIPGDIPRSKEAADAFVQSIKQQKIDDIEAMDLDKLIDDGKEKSLDYVMQAPAYLKPYAEKENEKYAFMRAQDTLKSAYAQTKVTKTLTDKNGGYVEKGDILTVNVSVTGGSNIDYLERLDLPVVIYKDEFNRIPSFQSGIGGDIDRNIGQGYEFMISGASGGSFTYDVMYNGNGHARVTVETDLDGFFESGTSRTSWFGETAYAASPRTIRVYPDDACYKGYREYSPSESFVSREAEYEERRNVFVDYFTEQREDLQDEVTDPNLDSIKRLMGLHEVDFDEDFWSSMEDVINSVGGDASFSIDIGTEYLDGYADTLEAAANTLCKGIKFGETNAGGLPVPFNMAFLSPGTMNIFGCKLFDDPGLPVVSFPTTFYSPVGPLPAFWPIFPQGAGGYFDYSIGKGGGESGNFNVQKRPSSLGLPYTSKFRLYVSPTLTNGVGIAMCFADYNQPGLSLPAPFGDIMGNCIVMAAPIPKNSDDGGDAYSSNTGEEKDKLTATLSPETRDLQEIGTCDPTAQERSPFVSTATGGPVQMAGQANSVIGTLPGSASNYSSSNTGSFGGGAGNSQDLLALEQYTIQGGTEFDLEVQGGNIKGLRQCIMNTRFDKQIRYVANNMLNMQVTLILPDLSKVTEGFSEIGRLSEGFDLKKGRKSFDQMLNDAKHTGSQSQLVDPNSTFDKLFLPRDILDQLEDQFTNPFEEIANLFENTPFINIQQKRVRMQVPRLFEEDIARLELQFTTWLSRNTEIMEAWVELDVEGSEKVTAEMKVAISSMQKNLTMLKRYKQLPGLLYDYIHARDTYTTEVLDFADDVVTQLTGWLQTNAIRYSKYVDAIITMIGIIESRKPLIDFSHNRKTKCGKCSVDNYDYYSCKLSLFCVDLPVLPIPPFKIPDVYIDLSQIRLGVDILLPKFVFIPEKIYFPGLPDFPDPRDFELELDIELPDVPLLPAPPPLPQLPDVRLEADIELPNLPPAPLIPDLIPSVKMVVDIADFISTFFCIFKSGVGMVGEQGVKTRIEQLTQRTWSVEPFDSVSITLPDSPLEGYNYHVDAFVDLKVSFDELYNVFDELADKVNEGVSKGVDEFSDSVLQAPSSLLNNKVGTFLDVIDDGVKIELDLDVEEGIDKAIDEFGNISEVNNLVFDRPETDEAKMRYHGRYHTGGSVEKVKETLHNQYDIILSRQDMDIYHDTIAGISAWIDSDAAVRPDYASIDKAHEEFDTYIAGVQGGLQDMKSMLKNDYDGFLSSYVPETILLDAEQDEGLVRQFNVNLFDGNTEVINKITSQDHPLTSYVDMHKPLLVGYQNALEVNTPEQLNMSDLTHEASSNFINGLVDRYLGNEDGMFLAQSLPDQNQDQNLNQDEEEEVCIPKPQTDDIDGDGIPNQQDHEDIDGDGLNNSEDPDVDGDCIPNTTDPDIDGDKVENGKDSDCNGNGTGCGQDNDDDSDGLNDDVDDDNDNDGTPDDEEGDNDGDGITDDEDEDDDNDGTPDEEDETPFGEDEEEDKNEDEEDKDNQDGSGSGAGAGGGMENFAEKTGFEQVDFSQYIQGFFVEGTDKKYHNIIGRADKADEIYESNNYDFVDLNQDKEIDLMTRDANDIFIKYANQEDRYPGATGGGMQDIGTWASAEELAEAATENDGYINGIKVRDEQRVKYDFVREGNNYESMGFSRENSHEDAYLIRLSKKFDIQTEKSGDVGSEEDDGVQYIFMAPQGVTFSGYSVEVPGELSKKKISSYIDDETIIAVNYYDGRTDRISALLENVDQNWYYAKVTGLKLEKNGGGLFSSLDRTYTTVSPWSSQIVAGNQKRGDNAQPRLELELIRNKTGEIIPGGSEIGGYILTDYTLSGNRQDNGKVLENRISYDGEIIYFDKSDTLRLEGLYYEDPTLERFKFGALDQAGNETVTDVDISIISPTIDVVDVVDQESGFDVLTHMSATIDDGKVAFMRDRYGRWEQMNPFTYPVKPTDPDITGGLYVTNDEIRMQDGDGNAKASVDGNTGEIRLPTGDKNKDEDQGEDENKNQDTQIFVDFLAGIPEVAVVDTKNDSTLFRIGLTAKELLELVILDGRYSTNLITDSKFGSAFVGGTCILLDNACRIVVDAQGNILIPDPYNHEYQATYRYNEENASVSFVLQDILGNNVVRITFIIEPF